MATKKKVTRKGKPAAVSKPPKTVPGGASEAVAAAMAASARYLGRRFRGLPFTQALVHASRYCPADEALKVLTADKLPQGMRPVRQGKISEPEAIGRYIERYVELA